MSWPSFTDKTEYMPVIMHAGIIVYDFILRILFDNNLFLALNQMLLEEEILAAVEKVLDQHYG